MRSYSWPTPWARPASHDRVHRRFGWRIHGVVAASLVPNPANTAGYNVAWEKTVGINAMWALSIPVPFTKPVGAGAGDTSPTCPGLSAAQAPLPAHIGAMVAVRTGSTAAATR